MFFGKKKKIVGLALGSGGARGLAHIGVIRALVRNKIPIDMIAGSSSGALIGAWYACWKDLERMEKTVQKVTYKELVKVLIDPDWGAGLIKGKKTLDFFEEIFGGKKIEDLLVPYRAVATDLQTAENVIFDKGDLAEAVRASISVPLVYSPIEIGDQLLVDGGVSSPVPVEILKEMGADVVIAVNLDSVYFYEGKKKNGSFSTVDILKDSYFALRYNLAKKEVRMSDVVIEPRMKYVADFDFVQGKEAVEAGDQETERQMEKIKRLI